MKNNADAPKTIWLQLGDEPVGYAKSLLEGNVSWCPFKVFEYDIEYNLAEPNTVTITNAEYEQLKADAERYLWLRIARKEQMKLIIHTFKAELDEEIDKAGNK